MAVHVPVPLWVSPDGQLGYIPIHKNGSTSFQAHVLKLGWRRAFAAGAHPIPNNTVEDPDPGKILVITRDPIDRWRSGLLQTDFWGAATWSDIDWDDMHLWPQGRFLTEWRQFVDRMEFVDLADANLWLEMNLIPRCEYRKNVTADRLGT